MNGFQRAFATGSISLEHLRSLYHTQNPSPNSEQKQTQSVASAPTASSDDHAAIEMSMAFCRVVIGQSWPLDPALLQLASASSETTSLPPLRSLAGSAPLLSSSHSLFLPPGFDSFRLLFTPSTDAAPAPNPLSSGPGTLLTKPFHEYGGAMKEREEQMSLLEEKQQQRQQQQAKRNQKQSSEKLKSRSWLDSKTEDETGSLPCIEAANRRLPQVTQGGKTTAITPAPDSHVYLILDSAQVACWSFA